MKVPELKQCKIGWPGPAWIKDRKNWPETNEVIQNELAYKEQTSDSISMLLNNDQDKAKGSILDIMDVSRYGSIDKTRRVTAFVLRFVANLKTIIKKRKKEYNGRLSINKLKEAEEELIKGAQEEKMKGPKWKEIENNLKKGLLRFTGRLQNSSLPYCTKKPIFLANNHPLTRLYIERVHKLGLHWGARTTLAELRSKYWFPQARK